MAPNRGQIQQFLYAAGVRVAHGQPKLSVYRLRPTLAAGLPFSVELHALPMPPPLRTRADFAPLHCPRG